MKEKDCGCLDCKKCVGEEIYGELICKDDRHVCNESEIDNGCKKFEPDRGN